MSGHHSHWHRLAVCMWYFTFAMPQSIAVKGLTVLSMWAMVDMCSRTADCISLQTYRQPCIF